MADSAWIEAMHDELHQFDRLQVWELIDKPFGKKVIKLKWLWKNKKDEDQTVIRNKRDLVAKVHLRRSVEFEVNHLHQRSSMFSARSGFCDPINPEKVYLLRKALYGLKQAPRAWYDELSTFLMSKGFTKVPYTRKSTSGGIQFLVISCKLDVKDTKLHYNVSAEADMWRYLQVVLKNV
ncbi:gag-pol polyprotein [Tanacetum coccineum]|uniref:Gag-pol polyprotein n=1 Tax=Tanacetum coccineum TaxID=301880 RepID=A0ABQ5J1W4_9ASTR